MDNNKKNTAVSADCVVPVYESKFIKVFDLQYAPGKHYLDATRRGKDEIVATKTEEEFLRMVPDAVSCIVVLKVPDQEPQLLLSYEYRYPAGHYLLSVPAGLIDPEDKASGDPEKAELTAARREIHEETGILMQESDTIRVVNPCAFSTPGMTDESNGIVCAVISLPDLSVLSQKGAVGSEKFDGFCLVTKSEAAKILQDGRDAKGHFYPVYTMIALMYFVNDMWK